MSDRSELNYRALCQLAHLDPDSEHTAEEIVRELRRFGHARWDEVEVERQISKRRKPPGESRARNSK